MTRSRRRSPGSVLIFGADSRLVRNALLILTIAVITGRTSRTLGSAIFLVPDCKVLQRYKPILTRVPAIFASRYTEENVADAKCEIANENGSCSGVALPEAHIEPNGIEEDL